jgi:hypothetical protein
LEGFQETRNSKLFKQVVLQADAFTSVALASSAASDLKLILLFAMPA